MSIKSSLKILTFVCDMGTVGQEHLLCHWPLNMHESNLDMGYIRSFDLDMFRGLLLTILKCPMVGGWPMFPSLHSADK